MWPTPAQAQIDDVSRQCHGEKHGRPTPPPAADKCAYRQQQTGAGDKIDAQRQRRNAAAAAAVINYQGEEFEQHQNQNCVDDAPGRNEFAHAGVQAASSAWSATQAKNCISMSTERRIQLDDRQIEDGSKCYPDKIRHQQQAGVS